MTCPTCHDDGFIVRERDHIACPDCAMTDSEWEQFLEKARRNWTKSESKPSVVRHDEFVCTSCGRLIVSLVPREPAPTVCALCQHIDEFITDPAERAEVRKRLQV